MLELSGGFIFSLIRLSHINAVNPSSNIWPPFTVAVCGTQTRTSRACSQIGHKASPGTVVPLTTGRVARKCLTKPLDLELVEHVDSFDCGVAAWIEPERDPCLIEKSISAEVKSIVQPRNRPTFKAISLKSCVRPMRSREYLLALTTQ